MRWTSGPEEGRTCGVGRYVGILFGCRHVSSENGCSSYIFLYRYKYVLYRGVCIYKEVWEKLVFSFFGLLSLALVGSGRELIVASVVTA